MSQLEQYLKEAAELRKKYVTSGDWKEEFTHAIKTETDFRNLEISVRLCNLLKAMPDIKVFADLTNYSAYELRHRKGWGQVMVKEVSEMLSTAGLTLAGEDLEKMPVDELRQEVIRLRRQIKEIIGS